MAKIPTILEAGRADGKLINSNNVYDNNQQKFLSDKLEEIDNNHSALNDVVNSLADEEDITRNTDGKLQFKNKESGDGMGYVILRKNKSFAEQVTKENTIYEIRYDFDLNSEEVTIPNNCILKFNGGSINNGTIVGQNTIIKAEQIIIFKNDIIINGTWNNSIVYSKWFNFDITGLTDERQKFANLLRLVNSKSSIIKIQEGIIATSVISFKNNYNISFEGCGSSTIIKHFSNSALYLNPIQLNYTENITIKNLCVDGNILNQLVDTSKHSIYVTNSKNTVIENVEVYNSCDAIMLGYTDNLTSNVILKNCYFHNNYRNSLVLANCNYVSIINSIFKGYKETSALIDIEKHADNDSQKNILFQNCTIIKSLEEITNQEGVKPQYIKLITNGHTGENNITFDYCDIQEHLAIQGINNITIQNSKIISIENRGGSYFIIDNCSIINDFLLLNNIINIYTDTEYPILENVYINNLTLINKGEEHTTNGISIMGVKNFKICNSKIENVNNAFLLFYQCEQIFIENCIIKNNTIGIKVIGTTYNDLYIINSIIDCTNNYIDLIPSKTHIVVPAIINNEGKQIVDNVYFKSLLIYNKSTTAVNGQIYENSNGYLVYKSIDGVSSSTSRYLASPGEPSTLNTETYNKFFINTKTGIWYRGEPVYDSQGEPTYTLTLSPECVVSANNPTIKPTFIGQLYFKPNTRQFYIANGMKDINNWCTFDGECYNIKRFGTFSEKPNIPNNIGFRYFCTSGASIDGGTTEKQNIPIFYTGSDWVDANGNSVVAAT